MRIDQSLITPIVVKQHDDMPWPDHPVFYLLSADKLYLCRNHRFYRSCVPAPMCPTELARHPTSLIPKYPTIPQETIQQICGLFGHMSDQEGAEAIVLLAWDDDEQIVRTIVPEQVSAVRYGRWGTANPIGVKYKLPHNLPRHWDIFCDIHSHCYMAAYASQTDVDDEDTGNGLHIVVGRLDQEPPEFYAAAAIDGTRFMINTSKLIAGYQQRASFPNQWLDKITITNYVTFRDFQFETDKPAGATDENPDANSEKNTAKNSEKQHDGHEH